MKRSLLTLFTALFLLCVLSPSLAHAALAFVQEFDAKGTTTSLGSDCAITGTTTGNGLLITLFTNLNETAGAMTVSGETVDTSTVPTAVDGAEGIRLYTAFIKSLASGGTKTVASSFSGFINWGCSVIEVSGQDTTTFHDGSASNAELLVTGVDYSVNLTAASADSMIIAWSSNGGQAPTIVSGGYTYAAITNFANSGQFSAYAYDTDVGAAGSKTVTFNAVGSSIHTLTSAIAIKSAGGGAPTPVRHRVNNQ